METVVINGIKLHLSSPEDITIEWIGMQEYINDILAAWIVLNDKDIPMIPRLLGKPGVGKTTLAIAAAKRIKKPIYIFQCTSDTRPEDLLITPYLDENSKLSYYASPIVTAMIKGGVVILDEANRMNEKSWASLASLFDYRRSIESVITGLKIKAHPDFRCCVTMNEDASTFEVPDYIISRLQPKIVLDFPEIEEEEKILRYHVDFAPDRLIQLCVDYLQKAHDLDLDFSTRDGIHLLRYTLKLLEFNQTKTIDELFLESIRKNLGEDAIDLDKLAEKQKLKIPDNYYEFSNWTDNLSEFYDGFQNLTDFLNSNSDDDFIDDEDPPDDQD